MELEHSFTVPVAEDRAWDVLLDVERVAQCMPGATLQSVDGEEIRGSIQVKVGPITMTYQGTARFTERDQAAHIITLEASGKETRGAGTASAKVRSMLEGKGDETHVVVHTTFNVTGRPAQFGRGVMSDVGSRLIGIFADNLASVIATMPAEAPAANGTAGAPAEPLEPAALVDPAEPAESASEEALPIDVLNLTSRAWSSLRRDGLQTLGDLTRRSEQQLLAIDGVGPASLADIRSRLAERGLALADAARETVQKPVLPTEPAPAIDSDEEELANVMPLRPSRTEPPAPVAETPARERAAEAPSWQPSDNEALDLLDVAGVPVIKRVVPAAAALVAVLFVLFGLRRRRARRDR